jgi:hypothetical protein
MPATKRLGNVGSWSVKLRDDTPRTVTDQLAVDDAAWSQVIFLPGQFDAASLSYSDLLTMSIFTGVYRGRRNRTDLFGAHASIYLGDEQGHGPIRESALTKAAGTFDQWATDLRPSSLTAGSYLTSISTLNWSTIYKTARQDLDYVCDYFTGGALTFGQVYTWQVTDQLVLNVGAPSSFSTKTLLLSARGSGTDFTWPSAEAEFDVGYDAEDYVTKVIADNGTSANTSSGANVYEDGLGNNLVHEAYFNDTDTTATLTTLAAGQRVQHDQPEWRVTARTNAFAVMRLMEPGGVCRLWDPDRGLATINYGDPTLVTGLYYRGEVVHPSSFWCQSVTMPIEDGMGVYMHLADGSDEIIDLSPYVEWERPGATIEVGSPARRFAPPVSLSNLRW